MIIHSVVLFRRLDRPPRVEAPAVPEEPPLASRSAGGQPLPSSPHLTSPGPPLPG